MARTGDAAAALLPILALLCWCVGGAAAGENQFVERVIQSESDQVRNPSQEGGANESDATHAHRQDGKITDYFVLLGNGASRGLVSNSVFEVI